MWPLQPRTRLDNTDIVALSPFHVWLILQLRNKLNQDQSSRLQLQRDSLNKRNLEVAAMDRRLAELRQRLWKKKAALQQKENLPVSCALELKSSLCSSKISI